MADGETRSILCSKCSVPAQAVVADGQPNRIRCPECGREGELQQAMTDAAAYKVKEMLAMSLGRGTGKSIQHKATPNPKPAFILQG